MDISFCFVLAESTSNATTANVEDIDLDLDLTVAQYLSTFLPVDEGQQVETNKSSEPNVTTTSLQTPLALVEPIAGTSGGAGANHHQVSLEEVEVKFDDLNLKGVEDSQKGDGDDSSSTETDGDEETDSSYEYAINEALISSLLTHLRLKTNEENRKNVGTLSEVVRDKHESEKGKFFVFR